MGVVHLARKTAFSRNNMSAANIVCADYPTSAEHPDNDKAHMLIWGLVARSNNEVNVEALRKAVEHILVFKSL